MQHVLFINRHWVPSCLTKIVGPKEPQKKTSFAKQKTIAASILSKISQLLRLVLGNTTWWSYTWSEKQLGWWNWWYGFPICPAKRESDSKLWFLFLNTFQTLTIKQFSGWNPCLATSTASWILNFSRKDVPNFFSADVKAMADEVKKNTVASAGKSRAKSDEIGKLPLNSTVGWWLRLVIEPVLGIS